jgi:hypothetical protein
VTSFGGIVLLGAGAATTDLGFPSFVELGAAAGVEVAGGGDGASDDFSVSELDDAEVLVDGDGVFDVSISIVVSYVDIASKLVAESLVLAAILPDGFPVSKSL